jgi:subtilisin family serine protease
MRTWAGYRGHARHPLAVAVVIALLALGNAPGAPAGAATAGQRSGRAPSVEVVPPGPHAIPGRYIVTLAPGVSATEFAANERARGRQVDRVFTRALNGYAGALSPADVTRLAGDSRVERVEPDQVVNAVDTQQNPTWGLDRIDDRLLPLDSSYNYSTTASSVKAYVIDTGIRATHVDMSPRVIAGYDAVGGVNPPTSDCHGHGTHVAGTIGGTTYGVAKGITLVAVRVLDCSGSGTVAGVIDGIDWVTGDHAAGAPAVANMSLGGGLSTSLDDAVAASIADGVVYAVAAGNDNFDACFTSPARTPAALTVAASDSTDRRASFSNYGTCVDLFAPGVSITSGWATSDTATNTISGTSMATPHVTGVAALLLATWPGSTVQQVADAVVGMATPGIVTGAGSGTPNRLLYVGSEPAPPPPPPAVPNDMFADAVVLTGASGSRTGTTVDATKEPGEPDHAGNVGGASVWYQITPAASGTATIDTIGSDFDTLLAVYTGTSVSALTEVASNDDIEMFFNVQSRVQLPVTAGVTYRIAVDGWSGLFPPETGSVTLNWTIPAAPPSGDTGWRNPTAQAASSTGDGNGYEISPANAFTNDGNVAADMNSGTSTSTSCTSTRKDRHVYRDYGVSLPTGAAVMGIEVQVQARADSTSGSPKICIQLSWDGGSSWTSAKSTGTLGTSETAYVRGSPTDTWGRAWSSSNLSNANFRVRVIDVSSSRSRDFYLDWVAVRVYY